MTAEVPLQQADNESQGINDLILQTWNNDGPSQEETRRLIYRRPVPRPEVLLVETPESANRTRPLVPLEFLVRSSTPLARLELIGEARGGGVQVVKRFATEALVRLPDGKFEVHQRTEVMLEPGPNVFEIVAVNAGGAGRGQILAKLYSAPRSGHDRGGRVAVRPCSPRRPSAPSDGRRGLAAADGRWPGQPVRQGGLGPTATR